jgi:hypothetical protein
VSEGALWAWPFAADRATAVISDPSLLGYDEICCMVGPDRKGMAVGYGYLKDGGGEVFQIDLNTGGFLALERQDDGSDDVGYWQAMNGGRTAIWLPDAPPADDRMPLGRIKVVDSAGRVVKSLSLPTANQIYFSADGRSVYAIVPRSRAYAAWHKSQNGPAPEKMGLPEAPMVVKIDVATETVTEVAGAGRFTVAWNEEVVWTDLGRDSSFVTLDGRTAKPVGLADDMLWTTDIAHRDLLLGLHVPWPEEQRIARQTCEEEYGVISALEPSTNKIKTLNVLCYDEDWGPQLTFGPWSGTAVPVKGR